MVETRRNKRKHEEVAAAEVEEDEQSSSGGIDENMTDEDFEALLHKRLKKEGYVLNTNGGANDTANTTTTKYDDDDYEKFLQEKDSDVEDSEDDADADADADQDQDQDDDEEEGDEDDESPSRARTLAAATSKSKSAPRSRYFRTQAQQHRYPPSDDEGGEEPGVMMEDYEPPTGQDMVPPLTAAEQAAEDAKFEQRLKAHLASGEGRWGRWEPEEEGEEEEEVKVDLLDDYDGENGDVYASVAAAGSPPSPSPSPSPSAVSSSDLSLDDIDDGAAAAEANLKIDFDAGIGPDGRDVDEDGASSSAISEGGTASHYSYEVDPGDRPWAEQPKAPRYFKWRVYLYVARVLNFMVRMRTLGVDPFDAETIRMQYPERVQDISLEEFDDDDDDDDVDDEFDEDGEDGEDGDEGEELERKFDPEGKGRAILHSIKPYAVEKAADRADAMLDLLLGMEQGELLECYKLAERYRKDMLNQGVNIAGRIFNQRPGEMYY